MQHQDHPVLSSTLNVGPGKPYIQAVTQVPVINKSIIIKHINNNYYKAIVHKFPWVIGLKTTLDSGRTQEGFINHKPQVSDLKILCCGISNRIRKQFLCVSI